METDPGLRQDGCCLSFLCRNNRTLVSSTLTEPELQEENKETAFIKKTNNNKLVIRRTNKSNYMR